tara:strand:- start:1286 stop:2014 length:729 start_codon:yes stop_codon:yes gene_type:complete
MKKDYTLSYSSIKEFAKSPAHYLAYINRERKSSPAMDLGIAVHMSILEPKKFKDRFSVTELRKNTNAFKDLQKENEKMKFLNKSDWYTVNKLTESVLSHPLASELLDGAERKEEWVEGMIKGIKFRGIVDAYGVNYLVDLKTCRDGSPKEFQRSAYNFQYYLQAAIYSELTGLEDFWIVTAETVAPYNITPYLIDKSYMEMGRRLLYRLIDDFKSWDGEWKGYDTMLSENEFFTLTPPAWAK